MLFYFCSAKAPVVFALAVLLALCTRGVRGEDFRQCSIEVTRSAGAAAPEASLRVTLTVGEANLAATLGVVLRLPLACACALAGLLEAAAAGDAVRTIFYQGGDPHTYRVGVWESIFAAATHATRARVVRGNTYSGAVCARGRCGWGCGWGRGIGGW